MTNQDVINQVSQEFAEEFIRSLEEAAKNKVTGSGSDRDFDVDFVKGASGAAATIVAQFQSHLRLYDMKKVVRKSNLDPAGIAQIKAWIERKGVSSFLAKYKYPTQVRKGGVLVSVPQTRIINNIAWGISNSRRKIKRKKWYNTKKGGSIYTLYARLVDAVLENSLKQAKESIENGN